MNFTKEEIAIRYRVSVATVDRWIKAGKLRPIRVGRRVLLSKEAVEDFLREHCGPETGLGGRKRQINHRR